MDNNTEKLKHKFEENKQELDEIKIAYSNLLHDVLSFNELLSKKDSTNEILTLVLRLAISIIDFPTGIIFSYEAGELKPAHSINLDSDFQEHIENYLSKNKYEPIILKKRADLIADETGNTYIIMPLVTKQQTVGLLDIIVKRPPSEIKQQDLDLLWLLCSIAAIEFESVEMSSRSELLGLLLTCLERINSEGKLDSLLYLILNNLRQIVPASSYLLILRDKYLEVSNNEKYCLPEIHSLDETCKLVDECIRNKVTIFVKKLSENSNCKQCTESYLHKDHDGSLMLVPLYKGDLSYGVISIYDKDMLGNVFTQYNRHIIEIFAKQATIAINNAILYDQQKKSNQQLAIANEELSDKNIELDNKQNELIKNQNALQKALKEIHYKNSILSKEIESAGVVQSAILSKSDKPENLLYQIGYKPHHSIGGDYFGIVSIDEYQSLVYIGDVSGKGVPAAIMTGFLKNEFSFMINKYKNSGNVDPAKILSEVNSSSIEVFKVTEQFTSAWCGLIDSKRKILTFASAGHDYPILINDSIQFIDTNNGPIMGLFDTIEYNNLEIDLTPPTKLLLYTDGITDQEINDNKRLSREWLLAKVTELTNKNVKNLSEQLICEVQRISEGMPQHDDMLTIVLSLIDN